MKKLLVPSLVVLLVTAFGVAGVQESAMQNCPMKLTGTKVAVADTETGIVVTLTTTPENVPELQRRVEHLAAMHSGEPGTEAENKSMTMGQMIPAVVKVEKLEDGARLTLTPKDPAKLEEFRLRARAHVERMKTGSCSMMQTMGGMRGLGSQAEGQTDHSQHH